MTRRIHRLRKRRLGGAWVLSLPSAFGAEVEEDLVPAAEGAFAAGATRIVLDFASVELASSAGIGAIVDLLRRARERNVPVVLAAVKGQPRVILDRVGFLAVVPSYDSVDQALEGGPAS